MKALYVLIGIVVVIALWFSTFYNSLVGMNESLSSTSAQVQNMYERRVDLIPQVAAIVKKYTQYEKSTLTEIVKLREESANLDKLTNLVKSGNISSSEVSGLLSSTLSQIRVTMEAYPTLKADTQFTNLFTELEGSENRIRVAIKDYNDEVVGYNTKINGFPGNIISGMFGFKPRQRILPPEGKDIKAIPDVNNLLDPNK